MKAQAPGFGPVPDTQTAYYTGCNINATAASRTAATVDVVKGSILQFDLYDHDDKAGLSTDSGNINPGFIVAIPTAVKSPVCAVVESPGDYINDVVADSGSSRPANAPRGGPVKVATRGIMEVLVKGNITKGDDLCLANAAVQYLEPATVGTNTERDTIVGAATAKVLARALETANVTATNGGLMWVEFNGQSF